VRKRLRRLGWTSPPPPEQLDLPSLSGADPNLSGRLTDGSPATVGEAPASPSSSADPNLSDSPRPSPPLDEPTPATFDTDPKNRDGDRLFAMLGLLDDAAPLFRDGQAVPEAGVLLAIPDLLATDVFGAAKQVWGSTGPAFYGLRTTIMVLLLMALLRVQRPEGLKERSALDFGRALGLDRAPEVKTVRRKLDHLAEAGGGEPFGHLLAQRRVATPGHTMGFLYLDGHVRIYYGKHRFAWGDSSRMVMVTAKATPRAPCSCPAPTRSPRSTPSPPLHLRPGAEARIKGALCAEGVLRGPGPGGTLAQALVLPRCACPTSSVSSSSSRARPTRIADMDVLPRPQDTARRSAAERHVMRSGGTI
jgi:hypothetical protein